MSNNDKASPALITQTKITNESVELHKGDKTIITQTEHWLSSKEENDFSSSARGSTDLHQHQSYLSF